MKFKFKKKKLLFKIKKLYNICTLFVIKIFKNNIAVSFEYFNTIKIVF